MYSGVAELSPANPKQKLSSSRESHARQHAHSGCIDDFVECYVTIENLLKCDETLTPPPPTTTTTTPTHTLRRSKITTVLTGVIAKFYSLSRNVNKCVGHTVRTI